MFEDGPLKRPKGIVQLPQFFIGQPFRGQLGALLRYLGAHHVCEWRGFDDDAFVEDASAALGRRRDHDPLAGWLVDHAEPVDDPKRLADRVSADPEKPGKM